MARATPDVPELAPSSVGVGLKAAHGQALLGGDGAIDWLEIHAENYLVDGGPRHRLLGELSERYALSIHGVGASLMSATPVDAEHLEALAQLVRRYRPALVSEHLAWSAWGGTAYNDLLPAPCNRESLAATIANLQRLQDAIGHRVLIENPSLYLRPAGSEMTEGEFLNALASASGCGLLLDINNVVVSCANLGESTDSWLDTIDPAAVHQIHLAGHTVEDCGGHRLRIDDHGSAVADETWALFERWVARHGPRPTLIEWDTRIPQWATLRGEALRARRIQRNLSRAA